MVVSSIKGLLGPILSSSSRCTLPLYVSTDKILNTNIQIHHLFVFFFTAYPFWTNFTDPIICPKTSLILKEAIYYCLIPIPFWGMIIIRFAAQTSRSVESKTQTIMKRKISITLWVVYEEWQVFPVSVIQYRACNCTSRRFL